LLEEQAQNLVSAANILAVSSQAKFQEQFPLLADIDSSRWDFFFTVAGISVGLLGLANEVASEERYDRLTTIIRGEILKWNPSAEDAMGNCMTYIHFQLDTDAPDDPQAAYTGLAFALGTWILSSSLGRPISEEDSNYAIVIGGFVLASLHDWWADN
jgi:hypothetical protein